jgi:hypothetical protein
MMSFGLTIVPTYFMDLIDMVFMESLDKFIVVFIDGILIYSKSKEELEEHLYLVLQKLQDLRLYVELSKCEFWIKRVSFLSHVISEGVHVDSSKIWDVLSEDTPASVIDVRSPRGILGYYHRFIKEILMITKPMTELLGKD